MKVYKFHADLGRMGDLHGVFVATSDQIQKALGRDAYFGEVLGKHSDINVPLKGDMFKVLTDDVDFVSKFIRYQCESGFNPLHYLDDELANG